MRYEELSPAEQTRLLAAYDAGVAAGSAQPWLIDEDDAELIRIITSVANVWWMGREVWQTAQRQIEPPLPPELIPEWLRAHAERQVLEVRETAPLGGGQQ